MNINLDLDLDLNLVISIAVAILVAGLTKYILLSCMKFFVASFKK